MIKIINYKNAIESNSAVGIRYRKCRPNTIHKDEALGQFKMY